VIDALVDAGFSAQRACRVLGVSRQGYYRYRRRAMSPTMMRREWLTALIRQVHAASRGTYGSRRVRAELVQGRGIGVSERLVWRLMHDAGIHGLPGPAKAKKVRGIPTSDDLVERRFARSRLNELWVSDITEHATKEGKVFCCCVMDTCSRKIIGWSIDTVQDSQLVINALDMAISRRTVRAGGIVHTDHGVQFTSWAFTEKVRAAGLMPSFGSVGDAFDNAMMASFWSSMQNELLNRKRWTTRIELSNAIFEYIEVFYNRNRRHSQLGYVSPTEYELTLTQETA